MNYSASCRLPSGNTAFDTLFDNVFKPAAQVRRRTGLPVRVAESETHYTLAAEVPGVTAEGINLTITQDSLTLEVEKAAPEQAEGANWLLDEHRYGTFSRTLNFRDPVDSDASEAKLEHGVLTVTVPKTRQAQPRKIQIKQG